MAIIKNYIFKYSTLFFLIAIQASCVDREATYSKILGSWETLSNGDETSCITYTNNERYHLFQRLVKIDYAAQVAKSSGSEPAGEGDVNGPDINQSEDNGEDQEPEFGVRYRAGYWNAARGGRLWMRGAKVRDIFGHEIPEAVRVMDKGSWRVVKFEGDDAWTMREIEGRPDRRAFQRIENCDHFEKEVNMVFKDPIWPEEIKAKRLQQLETEKPSSGKQTDP